ncbi:hypothetical protein HPB49_022760 [Dermacentor silvarum]|uniref:Uncharacterized protein n=1 Tax=Dermacentor silvarum TaxID=543639 RepID=A0ACB8CHP8_DERSI|nr:hypothetical protein HPB49_022760 [Dermacentor silvarum]
MRKLYSVSESSTQGSKTGTKLGAKEGDVKQAAGSNITAFLCAGGVCCGGVLIVVALGTFMYHGRKLDNDVLELLAAEEYEFAGWATVSDVSECSSVVLYQSSTKSLRRLNVTDADYLMTDVNEHGTHCITGVDLPPTEHFKYFRSLVWTEGCLEQEATRASESP